MKHLRITEPGFQKMTDVMGGIEFVDGVSVEPLSDMQAARICAAMRAEFTDGSNSSPAGLLVSEKNVRADVAVQMKRGITNVQRYIDNHLTHREVKVEIDARRKMSREDLEFIADEDGIAKLREVAAEFNVKGNSIAKIIAGILSAQGE